MLSHTLFQIKKNVHAKFIHYLLFHMKPDAINIIADLPLSVNKIFVIVLIIYDKKQSLLYLYGLII